MYINKKDTLLADGDWECGECRNINESQTIQCRKCKKKRDKFDKKNISYYF